MELMNDLPWGWLITGVILILGIIALIWIPAIVNCNELGGELVVNAFNWPVCVPSAGQIR
jgi:hypothetical protein